MMNIKELKKLTNYCRKAGILHLKTADMEISLSPAALFPEPKQTETESDTTPTKPALTDEDILFWSSAGIPEEAKE